MSLVHAVLLSASAILGPAADPPERPNIVLVFADDLGYGDLSCTGHPTIHTPRLDRMAAEGVRLSAFYAAASVCTPSRAALMTGRYPIRFGLAGNLGPASKGGLPAAERSLAEALKEQGYRTAAFGKWHLGSVPGFFPTDHGFDEFFGLPYSNDMIPPWVRTDRPLHLYRGDQPTDEQPVDQRRLTQRYTEEAVRFIRASKDQPFFVYLPHSMPHLPLKTSEEFRGRSRAGPYGDVIEELDASVGRLLDVLAEEGLDERTLVIFTSDNGPWRNMPPRMFDTEPVEKWHAGTTGPLRGAKATSYEGGLRVPCILRWPGQIPPARLLSGLSSTLDLHATILRRANCEPGPEPLDGVDLWGMLSGDEASPRESFHYFQGRCLEAMRDARFKLRIARPASDYGSPEIAPRDRPVRLELFDLWADPYERFDLSAAQPERVAELRGRMAAFAEQTGASLLQPAD